MPLVLKDRVKETCSAPGTGTVTLLGASTGYQSFAAIGDGNTTFYTIADQGGSNWEVGIGTYTASGTTLSRDTVLASSAGGTTKANFSSGAQEVFVTYPAEKSVNLDALGVANIADAAITDAAITNATLTNATVSSAPLAATDVTNKTYVDTLASSGIHFHAPVRVESPINLNATYNQPGGAGDGVGATLTNAGTQAALVIDGVTVSVNDRVLIYTQTTQTQNGVYVVTNVGSGSTNWILTRATDADTYGIVGPTTLSEGSTFFVQQGATGAGETYTCNTIGTITFGTTNITFAQISSAQIYSAGTGLDLVGTTFSLEVNYGDTLNPYASKTQNYVLASPNGSAGQPTFRALVAADVPTLNQNTTGTAANVTGTVAIANGGTGATTDSGARTALGLGTIATQAANNVAITGGLIETTKLQSYRETVNIVGTVSGSTQNLDLSTANIFDVTLGNNVTFTFTNPPASGTAINVTVILRQPAASAGKLATFTNANYTDGTAPILSTGVNQIDVLTFFTVNGGTFWFGTFAMANVS